MGAPASQRFPVQPGLLPLADYTVASGTELTDLGEQKGLEEAATTTHTLVAGPLTCSAPPEPRGHRTPPRSHASLCLDNWRCL